MKSYDDPDNFRLKSIIQVDRNETVHIITIFMEKLHNQYGEKLQRNIVRADWHWLQLRDSSYRNITNDIISIKLEGM